MSIMNNHSVNVTVSAEIAENARRKAERMADIDRQCRSIWQAAAERRAAQEAASRADARAERAARAAARADADERNATRWELLQAAAIADVRAIRAGAETDGSLYTFAAACVRSLLKKLADPQAAKAPERDKVSDNGQNPNMVRMKNELNAAIDSLNELYEAVNASEVLEMNKNGEWANICTDKSAEECANALIAETIPDAVDLAQLAACVLLDLAYQYDDGTDENWLEKVVTIPKKRKMRIVGKNDSDNGEKFENVAVIRILYRKLREYVQKSASVKVDPKSAYTYIDNLDDNGDGILYRYAKYADVGGYDCNGLYTGNAEIAEYFEHKRIEMGLSDANNTVLEYLLRGYTHGEIAHAMGVSRQRISKRVADIRKAAEKVGLTAEKYHKMMANSI